MSPAEVKALRPGDIVEFRGDGCYWLGKLTRLDKSGDWVVTNHGLGFRGEHVAALRQFPERFVLVGYSDYVA